MVCLRIICEGQTEERFIKDAVRPALTGLNVFAEPFLMATSSVAKGGAVTIGRFTDNATRLLKNRSNDFVTSLIDLYALDQDFPKFGRAARETELTKKLSMLETALHDHVVAAAACRKERFIPYIQPHEFEGLLFSDVDALAEIESGWNDAVSKLKRVRDQFETPEHINDGRETAPSKRLEKILSNPKYKKTSHGPRAAKAITLSVMERECDHFRGWMDRLRALGSA